MFCLLFSILLTQFVHTADQRPQILPGQQTNGVHSPPVQNEELSLNGGRIFADDDGPRDKLPINQCGNPICPLMGRLFTVGEVVYVLNIEVPNIPFNRQVDCISENGMIRLMTEDASGPNVQTWKHPLDQRPDSPDRSISDYKRFHLVRSIPMLQAPNHPFGQDPNLLPPNLGADFIQQVSSQHSETKNILIKVLLLLIPLSFLSLFFTSNKSTSKQNAYTYFLDNI